MLHRQSIFQRQRCLTTKCLCTYKFKICVLSNVFFVVNPFCRKVVLPLSKNFLVVIINSKRLARRRCVFLWSSDGAGEKSSLVGTGNANGERRQPLPKIFHMMPVVADTCMSWAISWEDRGNKISTIEEGSKAWYNKGRPSLPCLSTTPSLRPIFAHQVFLNYHNLMHTTKYVGHA